MPVSGHIPSTVFRKGTRHMKRAVSLLFIVSSLTHFVFASTPSLAISGTVRDRAGKPVAGAVVSLPGQSLLDTTDTHGHFSFGSDGIEGDGTESRQVENDNPRKGRSRGYAAITPDLEQISAAFSRDRESPLDSLIVSKDGTQSARPITAPVDTGLVITLDLIPAYYVDKVDQTPDYYQQNGAFGGFPAGGTQYCGPTSVSNGLVWLARSGFDRLLPDGESPREQQYRLIAGLGQKGYMGVGKYGIGPVGVTKGLQRYLEEQGYTSAKVYYHGWRPVERSFMGESKVPDLEWLKESLVGNSMVWLNIGWYKYHRKTDTWERTGGHWVTMVGYGHDGRRADPNTLIIHDPATRFSRTEYFKTKPIPSGSLDGKYYGLPRSAEGYLYVPSKKAIIDGAVVLEME
jgi:hypothetical protein